MIVLRPYQQAAIDCLNAHMAAHDSNPCVVLPTGSGKTPTMAVLIRQYLEAWPGTRICVLAHVKELVDQNARKLSEVWPEAPLGIFSAGLKSRQIAPVMFASIQSVYRRAREIGPFDLIFVDEAHRIPTAGWGMYRAFLSDLRDMTAHLRVIGWTATPYRLGAGMVVGPHAVLGAIVFEANVSDLIREGYLCRLISRGSKYQPDLLGVHVRQGEYVAKELEAAVTRSDLVERTCSEIVRLAHDRRAWLIFCVSKAHARRVRDGLLNLGIVAPVVCEDTQPAERDGLIAAFREGKLTALCNINVLSEGFDAPHIDCIVMLRPTKSAGLYYQQAGRELRQSPGKTDCLVLDFAGNVKEHGPIDAIVPPKERKKGCALVKGCPECDAYMPPSATECPECGYEFPPPERRQSSAHGDKAQDVQILRGAAPVRSQRIAIDHVEYRRHEKPGKPASLRVDYYASSGIARYSEWVCFEHQGFARTKAVTWWRKRAPDWSPVPGTVS